MEKKWGGLILPKKTYLYKIVETYNKLPKELTLIKEQHLFKKWIKKIDRVDLIYMIF